MLAEPYQTVFNKIRDSLTHDFIGLPEVPLALMVGNSKLNRLIELNMYSSGHHVHDANFFQTYTKLTAFEMEADFALTYTEGWTIRDLMMGGATLDQMREAVEPYGGIENHPDAKEILLVSLECLDKTYHTETCPILPNRKLGAWEQIALPDIQGVLGGILEICRDPKSFDKYQAFMERLTHQPPPTEMH